MMTDRVKSTWPAASLLARSSQLTFIGIPRSSRRTAFAMCTCFALFACDDGSRITVVEPTASPQSPIAPGNDGGVTDTDSVAPGADPVTPDNGTPGTDTPDTSPTVPDNDPGATLDIPATVPPQDGVPSIIAADNTLPQLPAGTRAQAYTGEFDSSPGIFIINDSDRLIGLVETGDGQSVSVRADIDAEGPSSTLALRRFSHDQQPSVNSQISSRVISAFASQAETPVNHPAEIIDGLQINSLGGDIFYALQAGDTRQLQPISADTLQGQWSSNYSLCDSNGNQCASVVFNLLVAGSQLGGNAGVIAADGSNLLPSQLSGSISQRGDVVDVELRWNTYRYTGFAFVKPANPTDLYMVLTTDSEIADERMLALTLVRFQS